MITVVAFTIGLVVWLVVWATGAKPIDAFLLTLLIVLPAATWQIFGPGIKKMLTGEEPPSG